MHLYETHVPVTSTETSAKFYADIVGLRKSIRDIGISAVAGIGPTSFMTGMPQ